MVARPRRPSSSACCCACSAAAAGAAGRRAVYGERPDALGFRRERVAHGRLGHVMRRPAVRAARPSSMRASRPRRRRRHLAGGRVSWRRCPYMWVGPRPVDALFESMSGLTTTGATVFADFSRFGRGMFFWRALTHWLGGMGVIALFVAVLPRLAIGGRELFFAEASGPDRREADAADPSDGGALWQLYAALTALQVVALMLAGMPLYDAVCNAFATIAAGGFSPHPQSITGYQSPAVEWVMHRVHVPRRRQLRAAVSRAQRQPRLRSVSATKSSRLRRDRRRRDRRPRVVTRSRDSHRRATRSGTPCSRWCRSSRPRASPAPIFSSGTIRRRSVLLVLMFIGGCAGSAGGGPKVVRHVLHRAVHAAGVAAHAAPARGPAGQARRARRARRR